MVGQVTYQRSIVSSATALRTTNVVCSWVRELLLAIVTSGRPATPQPTVLTMSFALTMSKDTLFTVGLGCKGMLRAGCRSMLRWREWRGFDSKEKNKRYKRPRVFVREVAPGCPGRMSKGSPDRALPADRKEWTVAIDSSGGSVMHRGACPEPFLSTAHARHHAMTTR